MNFVVLGVVSSLKTHNLVTNLINSRTERTLRVLFFIVEVLELRLPLFLVMDQIVKFNFSRSVGKSTLLLNDPNTVFVQFWLKLVLLSLLSILFVLVLVNLLDFSLMNLNSFHVDFVSIID